MTDLSFLTRLPIAHRGLHNQAKNIVENSGGAIRAAIKHGYAIEIDVQLTKDQKAIVFHDETLDRVTGLNGKVIDYTLAELQQIRYNAGDETIISFGELLELVDGQVPLIIEVKSRFDNVGPLEAYIAKMMDGYDGDICIMSFNPLTVRKFRQIAPHIIRGIVAEYIMSPTDWRGINALGRFFIKNFVHWPLTRPNFISYHLHDLPSLSITLARKLGIPVISWTIKSPSDAEISAKYADQITFEGFLPPK
ncbi:MAG: glycerophosphodiester phosphodiesterase [Rhizobiales bacterium]|nr:glycerophosphodiester phosphodiesterase [Hyphomicrobiales bacterium]NRB14993.1 glycerophosphodiester phosphodiesterase [Hyphomicrobiales bacterium]